MTRAWVFILHGRISDALAANPFVLVALPAAMAVVAVACFALVRRKPAPDLAGAWRHPGAKALLAA